MYVVKISKAVKRYISGRIITDMLTALREQEGG